MAGGMVTLSANDSPHTKPFDSGVIGRLARQATANSTACPKNTTYPNTGQVKNVDCRLQMARPQPRSLVRRLFAGRQYQFLYFAEGSPHLLWRLDIEYPRPQRLEGRFQLIGDILRGATMTHGTIHARTPFSSPYCSVVADVDDTASRQAFKRNRFQVFAGLENHGCGKNHENAGHFRGAEQSAYLRDEELGVVMPLGERVNINGGRSRFPQRFLEPWPIEIVYFVLVERCALAGEI